MHALPMHGCMHACGVGRRLSNTLAACVQGGSVGHTFEQLAYIIRHVRDKTRVGVCLDTCHMFAAGYDVSTAEGYADTMARFGEVVGFDRLKGGPPAARLLTCICSCCARLCSNPVAEQGNGLLKEQSSSTRKLACAWHIHVPEACNWAGVV